MFSSKNIYIKVLVAIGAVALSLVILIFGMRLIESRSSNEEGRIGDSGDWGKKTADEAGDDTETGDENVLTIGGHELVYTDDIRTFLIIGTDGTGRSSGSNSTSGEPGTEGSAVGDSGGISDARASSGGEMADFLMLMIINRTQDSYGFIQLNRDTMMDVPMLDENGEFIGTYPEQLCIAHWYGRTSEERNENTVYAVSRLMGDLNIDGYYAINMDDIGVVNNAIGGVMVTIEDDMTMVDPEFTKGAEILLKDDQAEKYLRARMSVGEGTNEERMSRQLTYMQAAYRRLINQIRENPNYINDIYSEVSDVFETDRPAKQLSEFAKYISGSESRGFLTIDGESGIGDTLDDGVEHAEFHMDEGSQISTLKQLIDLKES